MDPAVDHAQDSKSDGHHSPNAASNASPFASLPSPSPSLSPSDQNPNSPPKSTADSAMPPDSDPSPAPLSAMESAKNAMETVRNVLNRWGKAVGETAKKADDLSRNTWQHLKTGPSFTDAALGRLAQGTKLIAEGGYENIFRQTFETLPEEKLKECYACYLSTSAGPVMGVLYLSSAKLAFCSDNPLSYKVNDKTEWSYYKVVIPLHQLTAINSSVSETNSAEKYIQIASIDNHEFWFMGFLYYDSAVELLESILREVHDSQA